MKRLFAVLLIGALGLVPLVGVATAGGNAAPSAQEEAQTERVWLGVRVVKLNERIAERLESEYTSGVVVVGVQDDSPAAEAGLQ